MKDRLEMNSKQIAELKAELDQMRGSFDELKATTSTIQSLLFQLQPTTEAIRTTQVQIAEVTKDTNSEAHKVKHGVDAFPRNMRGFVEMVDDQYKKMNASIAKVEMAAAKLEVQKEYNDEKFDVLEAYMGEIRAIVSTQLFREIVEENKLSKQFRTRAQNVWWFLLSIGAFAAVIAGVIAAIKGITNLMK